jgi:hypothetical protein
MRSYDVAIAALAADAPLKWVDNLLSQHTVPGVIRATRGVPRELTYPAILRIALVRELQAEIGVGVRDALALAADLLDRSADAVPARGHLRVTLDRAALEGEVGARLAEALESAPAPRRRRAARRAG